MKIRVAYTVDVSDEYRRAINLHFGQPGLATRQQVIDYLQLNGSQGDDDLMWDLQTAVIAGDEPEGQP